MITSLITSFSILHLFLIFNIYQNVLLLRVFFTLKIFYDKKQTIGISDLTMIYQ